MDNEIVWLTYYRTYAKLVSRGAFFSVVEIPDAGRVLIENDDYEFWEDRAIEFESEE